MKSKTKMLPPRDFVCLGGLIPSYTGTSRSSMFVPPHCLVRSMLIEDGLVIGGPDSPDMRGAKLYAGDGQPVIARLRPGRGNLFNDIIVIERPEQAVLLAPWRNANTLSLREIMLPTANVHATEVNATAHKVQNGSILIAGDTTGAMRLVCYFFVDTNLDHALFSSMLDQSESHMREIWSKFGALRTMPPPLFAVNTHVSTIPVGMHPIVRDVLMLLQERARYAGDDLLVRLVDALAVMGGRR